MFANCLLSSSSSDSFNCKALDKKVGLDDESFTSDFSPPFNCNALEKSAVSLFDDKATTVETAGVFGGTGGQNV